MNLPSTEWWNEFDRKHGCFSHLYKALDVINSCQTTEQTSTAYAYIRLMKNKYNLSYKHWCVLDEALTDKYTEIRFRNIY